MERTLITDLSKQVDTEVLIKGWVHVRRDQGKMVFFDLRDASGIIQCITLPSYEDAITTAKEMRPEWVVSIKGKVNQRPDKMVNHNEINGSIEVEVIEIEVLNDAQTPPFEITEDTKDIDENTRLKYRYLDLRTERMNKNIRLRSDFVKLCREYLYAQRFTEIETPMLTESTPEGSRDFVVPSRHNKGKFYALPQSPQQYKQLLMVASFERYFQLARAMRDEDLRADRAFEHTQIDLEISFVTQEDVMNLVENMITHAVEALGYTIKEKPFPRITYKDAMEKYGDDKFDMRTKEEKEKGILAYAWVVDFPFFEKTDDGKWTFSHNPFSMPKEEYIEDLLNGENIENILTTQYDIVCNGFESGGGSIRSHRPDILKAVYKVMGYSEEEMNERVGHMIDAFTYGAPPHGGIALGVERNLMNLTGEDSLREVQAFPQTRRGQTAVMNAPKELDEEQLRELGLKIDKK